MGISDDVVKQRKEIKSDRLDMSFGEIINMYKEKEIIISPEYQRAFRWNNERQTDFIESILLGIPFPSIFVAANDDGKWELVDGLQRVSTVLSFFGEFTQDESKNNLVLGEGDILKSLRGMDASSLPLDLRLSIKRTACRVEIIQKESDFQMRYELFKRLNTGGEGLTRQEIRNCVFRGFKEFHYFNDVIKEAAGNKHFKKMVWISDDDIQKMAYEENCLRFFALSTGMDTYKEQSIQNFFDRIMGEQCENPNKDMLEKTFSKFKEICEYLNQTEENVFKFARLNFSTSMYDSIMLSLMNVENLNEIQIKDFVEKINLLKNIPDFKRFAGAASSSPSNIKGKIEIAKSVLLSGYE